MAGSSACGRTMRDGRAISRVGMCGIVAVSVAAAVAGCGWRGADQTGLSATCQGLLSPVPTGRPAVVRSGHELRDPAARRNS